MTMVVIEGQDFVLGLRLGVGDDFDVVATSRCSICNKAIFYHPDLRGSEDPRICTICAAEKMGLVPLEGVARQPTERQMKLWREK